MKIIQWLARAFSEWNGRPSSSRLLFGATVFTGLALIIFVVLKDGAFHSETIAALGLLLTATSAAYAVPKSINPDVPAAPLTPP